MEPEPNPPPKQQPNPPPEPEPNQPPEEVDDLSGVKKVKIYFVVSPGQSGWLDDKELIKRIQKETSVQFRTYEDCQSQDITVRISAYERQESFSATSFAASKLFGHCRDVLEDSILSIRLLVKQSNRAYLSTEQFTEWLRGEGESVAVTQLERGNYVIKITGLKQYSYATFMELVEMLRNRVFEN